MDYAYQTADPALYGRLKEYARHNRNHPTEAEALLWEHLRDNGIGQPFKRQHIIGDYIADFACLPRRLVIELDGGYHRQNRQQEADSMRTEWLESKGFIVLRFTNEELFRNINQVLNEIQKYL